MKRSLINIAVTVFVIAALCGCSGKDIATEEQNSSETMDDFSGEEVKPFDDDVLEGIKTWEGLAISADTSQKAIEEEISRRIQMIWETEMHMSSAEVATKLTKTGKDIYEGEIDVGFLTDYVFAQWKAYVDVRAGKGLFEWHILR